MVSVQRNFIIPALTFFIIIFSFACKTSQENNQTALELASEILATPHPAPDLADGKERSDEWKNLLARYESKDYMGMIKALQPDIDAGNVNTEKILYFGLAHFYKERKNRKLAAQYLKIVEGRKPKVYGGMTDWYKALIYVQKGAPEKARLHLEEILKTESQFRDQAALLLSKI